MAGQGDKFVGALTHLQLLGPSYHIDKHKVMLQITLTCWQTPFGVVKNMMAPIQCLRDWGGGSGGGRH